MHAIQIEVGLGVAIEIVADDVIDQFGAEARRAAWP